MKRGAERLLIFLNGGSELAWYAVTIGRKPGVYSDRAEARAQVIGLEHYEIRRFNSELKAHMFMRKHIKEMARLMEKEKLFTPRKRRLSDKTPQEVEQQFQRENYHIRCHRTNPNWIRSGKPRGIRHESSGLKSVA